MFVFIVVVDDIHPSNIWNASVGYHHPSPKKRKVTLNNIWNIQGHQMKASYQKELLIDDKHVLVDNMH